MKDQKIFMYVPGMAFDGNTIKNNQSLGGSETMGLYVARELAARGNDVTIFSNNQHRQVTEIDGVKYIPIGNCTQETPFGDVFEQHALYEEHDVLICQRVPNFFAKQWNSKINLWWTHDLALKRSQGQMNSQLWNIDKVLCVSNWHKEQVQQVYGIDKDYVDVLPNGIDPYLYSSPIDVERKLNSKVMIYSSRPERGLENLVRPDGIMHKLLEKDPNIKLVVCGYDNTTDQMRDYYNQLWQWCEQLPNVVNIGPQSKTALAEIMRNAWLHVYPTQFEETSCITAMEEQASGTPFMTCAVGALEETLNDGGAIWIDHKNGEIDIDRFVEEISSLSKDGNNWENIHQKSLEKSKDYEIAKSADCLEKTIESVYEKGTSDRDRMFKHFIRRSDIVAANEYAKKYHTEKLDYINEHYAFAFDGKYAEHYDGFHQTLDDQGIHLGVENLEHVFNDNRLVPLRGLLDQQKDKRLKVLDYGCAFGQYTLALAQNYPNMEFIGVDISEKSISIAKEYRDKYKLSNVKFCTLREFLEKDEENYDVSYCAEVLEHIIDFKSVVKEVESRTKEGGVCVYTTPTGWNEYWKWDREIRQHVHCFTEKDIKDVFGHKKEFKVIYMQSGTTEAGEQYGSHCFKYVKQAEIGLGDIDYDYKFKHQNPKQTLSVCMIVKDDGLALGKTLNAIKNYADEIIIGIDGKGSLVNAWEVGRKFGAEVFDLGMSPTNPKLGYGPARNKTIEKAKCDWIMWIDDDEVVSWSHHLPKFLRNNYYQSYAVPQHHFSCDPVGNMKTDLPCRLFRNHIGVKFFGLVHEHPEIEVNKGIGHTFLLPQNELAIAHNGYENEQVRRKRFIRNFKLMQAEKKLVEKGELPIRELFQMLWIRDLIHANQFDLEQYRQVIPDMIDRCNEAIEWWLKLVEAKKTRLVIDALPYYSAAVDMLTNGAGTRFQIAVGMNKMGIGDQIIENGERVPAITASFMDEDHIRKFMECLVDERFNLFKDDKYF